MRAPPVVLAALALAAPLLVDGTSLRRHQQSLPRFTLDQLRGIEGELVNAVKAHPGAGGSSQHEVADTTLALQGLHARFAAAAKSGSNASGASRTLGIDEIDELIKTLKAGIKQTHESAVNRVHTLIAAFAQCNVDKDLQQAQLLGSNDILHAKHIAHQSCREEESKKHEATESCGTATEALKANKEATCNALDALMKDPGTAADVCHSQGEDYEDWVIRNRDYFTQIAEQIKGAREACEQATEELTAKLDDTSSGGCAAVASDWSAKKAECDGYQEALESATCSNGMKIHTMCDSFSNCWTNANMAYDDAKPGILEQIASIKSQWRAMQRMQCLMETFGAPDQEAAIDACIETKHDTSEFDVDLPPPPPQPDCGAESALPCSAAYKSMRYSSLPVGAPAAQCAPCSIVGGGANSAWVPIMKVMTNQFDYDSSSWEDDVLVNDMSPVPAEEDAKYQRYLDTPFKDIRMCVGAPEGHCVEHHFDSPWASARALFSAGFVRDETLDMHGFLNVFGVPEGAINSCPMQKPGFNLECAQNNRARWGFANNIKTQGCEPDMGDADAVIGVGLTGQDVPSQGAGYTKHFLGPSNSVSKSAKVWMYIKQSGPPVPSANGIMDGDWSLVMKIAANKDLGFSSPLWEDDNLLNPTSDKSNAAENAKYEAFLDKPFRSIRMCIGSPTGNCVPFTFQSQWASAKALFSSGYQREAGLDKYAILNAFGPTPGSYQNCGMQRPGFNIKCNDGNFARFGFCNNCPSQGCQVEDSNDADAAIGVGLRGQSTTTEMGAGWTNYFASGAGTCDPNSMTFKTAWLWVK